jgi:hypothetical protein
MSGVRASLQMGTILGGVAVAMIGFLAGRLSSGGSVVPKVLLLRVVVCKEKMFFVKFCFSGRKTEDQEVGIDS